MDNIQEYTEEIQEMFLKFLVSDPELFVRVNNIVEPYMFNKKYQDTVKFLKQHSTEYSSIPTIDQITATTGVELERIEGITENHSDWFLDSFEKFCRHKEVIGSNSYLFWSVRKRIFIWKSWPFDFYWIFFSLMGLLKQHFRTYSPFSILLSNV